jgi:hypothetical protein
VSVLALVAGLYVYFRGNPAGTPDSVSFQIVPAGIYLAPDGKVMSVHVNTTSATFESGTPKPLFTARIAGGPPAAPAHRWDVSQDGQRFLVTTVLDVMQSPPINIVTNWESALKR